MAFVKLSARSIPDSIRELPSKLQELEVRVELQELLLLELARDSDRDPDVFKADMARRLAVMKELREEE